MNEKTPRKTEKLLRLAVCIMAILALCSAFTYMLLEIVRDNNETKKLLLEAFFAIDDEPPSSAVSSEAPITASPSVTEAPTHRERITLDLSKDTLTVINGTSYSVDTDALLEASLPKHFFDTRPLILIYHSDPLASYWQGDSDRVPSFHPFQDEENNVIAVGASIRDLLASAGIAAIHVTDPIEDPIALLSNYRESFPSIRYCLDVRRDGIYTTDGRIVKSSCTIGNERSAQLMLAVGTDMNKESFEWQKNLAAAYQLADMIKNAEPDSMRPIYLRPESLSQGDDVIHLTLFVGTTGNTLDEAITSSRFFARYLALFILSHCGIE